MPLFTSGSLGLGLKNLVLFTSLDSPELVEILKPKLLRNWRAEALKMPNVSIAMGWKV